MRAPSAEYWFGTDRLGRDIFSRIVYGAQTSLFIGLGAVACAILFGSILGATAATSDKWGNEIIMRLMDILMAFPGIALAAVLLATFGNSVPVIIITIAVVYTRQLARVVRANVVSQWDEDYVRAERVIGGSRIYSSQTRCTQYCCTGFSLRNRNGGRCYSIRSFTFFLGCRCTTTTSFMG